VSPGVNKGATPAAVLVSASGSVTRSNSSHYDARAVPAALCAVWRGARQQSLAARRQSLAAFANDAMSAGIAKTLTGFAVAVFSRVGMAVA
jgi:hypothetical protein